MADTGTVTRELAMLFVSCALAQPSQNRVGKPCTQDVGTVEFHARPGYFDLVALGKAKLFFSQIQEGPTLTSIVFFSVLSIR